jgi:hypothetical protein
MVRYDGTPHAARRTQFPQLMREPLHGSGLGVHRLLGTSHRTTNRPYLAGPP